MISIEHSLRIVLLLFKFVFHHRISRSSPIDFCTVLTCFVLIARTINLFYLHHNLFNEHNYLVLVPNLIFKARNLNLYPNSSQQYFIYCEVLFIKIKLIGRLKT